MLLLLPSMFAAATIVVNSTSADFEAYKLAFGKNYTSTSEEARAKACWEENVADLAKKNEAAARAKSDLKFAENSFSDQCFADFAAQRLNLDPAANGVCTGSGGQGYPTPANEGMAVDWRPKGYVNSIKNQGSCGSCWVRRTAVRLTRRPPPQARPPNATDARAPCTGLLGDRRRRL